MSTTVINTAISTYFGEALYKLIIEQIPITEHTKLENYVGYLGFTDSLSPVKRRGLYESGFSKPITTLDFELWGDTQAQSFWWLCYQPTTDTLWKVKA